MRIMTLSGWGQPHDALAGLFPEATQLPYAHLPTADEAMHAIADAGKKHDVVIGWSLGGQLATRAIAAGMMQPKKLVLIASPFQFVKSPILPLGMPRDQYDKFRGNYAGNAARTLAKAWELVIKGDKHAGHIRTRFNDNNKQKVISDDWLKWLDNLDGFSFHGQSLQALPPTLLIHGTHDVVVNPEQSRHFATQLPQSKLVLLDGCGHAPHWHDENATREAVREFIRD